MLGSNDSTPAKSPSLVESAQEESVVRIKVDGMVCSSCSTAVRNALTALHGVRDASVSLATNVAVVRYAPSDADEAGFIPAVEAAGFDARLAAGAAFGGESHGGTAGGNQGEIRLRVDGMTCASCSGAVRRALEAVDGVQSAAVSLATNSAIVKLSPAGAASGAGSTAAPVAISLRQLVTVVEAAGFEAGPAGGSSEERLEAAAREQRAALWAWVGRLIVAAVLAVPVFALSMVPRDSAGGRQLYKGTFGVERLPRGHVAQAVLSLVVQCTVGWTFYEGTWRGLRGGCRMGMDTLVALGTSVAYLASVLELGLFAAGVGDGTKPATFFDTPALLLTFVSLGKLLEVLAKSRTSSAVTELLRLRPEQATVLEPIGAGDEGGAPTTSTSPSATGAGGAAASAALPGSDGGH